MPSNWEFGDLEGYNEIHLAGATQTTGENGFVYKDILRTGEWPAIPTKGGLVKRPLRVVRDGLSDFDSGTISMQEVIDNFKAGAMPNVPVPLSDDGVDHKNLTKLNTGFVRELILEDEEDGESRLVAAIEFTEPEVRDKALRGTFADVSSGIPWKIRSRGKEYGATLEHVCITNQPFIDDLGPFLAASASTEVAEDAEVEHYEVKLEKFSPADLTPEQKGEMISTALVSQLNLAPNLYDVSVTNGHATVSNTTANTSWQVPYTIDTTGTGVIVAPVVQWHTITGEVTPVVDPESAEDQAEEPEAEAPVETTELSALERARRLRKLYASAQGNSNPTKEGHMPLGREDLDGSNCLTHSATPSSRC